MVWILFLVSFFTLGQAQVDYLLDCVPLYGDISTQSNLTRESQQAAIFSACAQAVQAQAVQAQGFSNSVQIILLAIESVAFFISALFGYSLFR